jgi:hypothetical protein
MKKSGKSKSNECKRAESGKSIIGKKEGRKLEPAESKG